MHHLLGRTAKETSRIQPRAQRSRRPGGAVFAALAIALLAVLNTHAGAAEMRGSDNSASPAHVSAVASVDAGGSHSCGRRTDGTLACWGDNTYGQISGAPIGNGYSAVSAGGNHSCTLTTEGSIACWGDNTYGQLTGTPIGNGYSAVSAGGNHSCALVTDGSIVCWGDNTHGQLIGTPIGSPYSGLSAGGNHSCALVPDGTITCWGDDSFGQISGTPIGNGYSGLRLSAGGNHSCGLFPDGTITCWGDDSYGQISGTPIGNGYSAVSAGGNHSCAWGTEATLVCWGDNSNGQLAAAPQPPAPAPPSPAQIGSSYAHAFDPNGSPQASLTISAGSLPPGLSLSGSGVLYGTPTTAGTYTFTVAASNGFFADASAQFTIVVQSQPTAVSLSSLWATRTARGTVVRWRTSQESQLLGFHVYRKQGKFLKLNRRLIDSVSGGTTRGHAYSWLDRRPSKGAATYRIQAVTLNGTRSWIGSAVVPR
jgi:putative Ig domain-containing protein/Regulator of Chromosome Condensation (RCC1) repeat protein